MLYYKHTHDILYPNLLVFIYIFVYIFLFAHERAREEGEGDRDVMTQAYPLPPPPWPANPLACLQSLWIMTVVMRESIRKCNVTEGAPPVDVSTRTYTHTPHTPHLNLPFSKKKAKTHNTKPVPIQRLGYLFSPLPAGAQQIPSSNISARCCFVHAFSTILLTLVASLY